MNQLRQGEIKPWNYFRPFKQPEHYNEDETQSSYIFNRIRQFYDIMKYFLVSNDTVDTESKVVVMGNFDGVHLGHQELLRTARKFDENITILTFVNHTNVANSIHIEHTEKCCDVDKTFLFIRRSLRT